MIEKLNLLKNFRLFIFIVLALVSVYLLATSQISGKNGVVVSAIADDSKCTNLKTGDVITQVSGYQVKDVNDFRNSQASLRANEYVPMIINGGPGGCVASKEGYLGISVEETKSGGLKFSLDLYGGYVTNFSVKEKKESIEDIVDTIKKRVTSLGLLETVVTSSDDTITITSVEPSEFSLLTKRCEFSGHINQKLNFKNQTTNLNLGNESFKINFVDSNNVKISDIVYSLNQQFEFEGINFLVLNITSDYVELDGTVAKNNDATKLGVPSTVDFDRDRRVYFSNTPLQISAKASDRFVELTTKMDTKFVGGQVVLVSPLEFYIDNELIVGLDIPRNVAGRGLLTLSLVITSQGKNEVENKKTIVDMCLDSDLLESTLEKSEVKKFESPLFDQLILMMSVIFIILIITNLTISFKYKLNTKKILFGTLLTFLELLIILGLIVLTQEFSRFAWIIDTPTLIGITLLFTVNLILILSSEIKKISDVTMGKISLFKKYFLNKLDYFIIILGFVLLFTPWKGFGLALVSGSILWFLFVKSLYKSSFKQIPSQS